jgi:FkbM family methyltransferase
MMVYGRFSPELITLIKAIVRPGASVVDVGAQLGYVTAHLADLVGPEGSVQSFEPDPNAIAQLRATVRANHHEWVKILPIALGASDGEIDFYVSPTLGWSTAVPGTHRQGLTTVRVPVTTLDKLADAKMIRRPVQFVKIDVEGFEVEVLEGMKALLEQDRPCVLAEVNPVLLKPNGRTTGDLLTALERPGYRLFQVVEPQGVLNGGSVKLIPIDRSRSLDFCDVLAVPPGMQVPLELRPS